MSTSANQYSYGQPAVPPRRSGMTTAGKVLFLVGLILSVIAVVVGIWGINRAIQDFSAMQDDAVAVEGTATVPMDADDVRLILAPEGTDPACTVTGPAGTQVPVTSDAVLDQTSGADGIAVTGMFTANQAGEHTVSCESAAELSPAMGLGDAVGVGAAGIAFLSLFPLGFITLLGLVLWLVGRNRDKKSALDAAGYGYSTSSGSGAYAPEDRGNQGQGYGSPPPPGPGTRSPYTAPPPLGSDRGEAGDELGRRDGGQG